MKIELQQLSAQLKEKMAPAYLISGDEFLLVQEASDLIRQSAAQAGYNSRETFYLESGFNWEPFLTSFTNLSLFGEKTLIELYLKNKITEAGSKILQNCVKQLNPDKIILIISDKLEASQQKTAWFKAISTAGVFLPIWPITLAQLPLWITNRLKQAELKADSQGIKLLADMAAGNLLAASQEIEKLHLLYGSGSLSTEQIIAVITDNARFNIFNLLDSALAGNKSSLNRILEGLKAEKTEPTMILWAIARELRALINISFALKQGESIESVMIKNNVWSSRKALVNKVLSRHNLASLQNLLKHAIKVDKIIKGADPQGLLWHELYKLYFRLATC